MTAAAAMAAKASPAHTSAGEIALLPLLLGDMELECLRDTTFGLFPEARLASFLLRSLPAHKDHQDSMRVEVARSARYHARTGERFGFRLIASALDLPRMQAVVAWLQRGSVAPDDVSGHAFGGNWRLADPERPLALQALGHDEIAAEAVQWQHVTRFRLRLLSPTRIALRRSGARGRQRFCGSEAELDDATLSTALISSLVSLKFALKLPHWTVPALPLRVVRKELFLVDPGGRTVRHGAKPLDEGVLGEVLLEWSEPPTAVQWQHLVLLQYLGVGQARSFGLGQMQIETLDGSTHKRLPATRFDSLAAAAESTNFARAQAHVARRRDLASWPGLGVPETGQEDPPPPTLMAGLQRRLAAGAVVPQPLFAVEIPKPGGGMRELLIPDFADRVAQRAVLQTIEPGLDALFSDASFGFRRGRGRETARDRIEQLRARGFTSVAETDVQQFFDTVGWWRVETRLRCLFGRDPLVEQLMRWVESPRSDGVSRTQGLPQGAVLSPLLSNVMLDHLDRVLAGSACHCVRFADDMLILCRTPAQAEAALALTATTLADAGLQLKPGKTGITDFDRGFRFLGYRFVRSLAVESEDDAAPLAALPAPLLERLTPAPEASVERYALEGSGEEPGQLLVVNEPGARLSLMQGQLALRRTDGQCERYPFSALSAVLLLSRTTLSSEVIKAAMRANVVLHFLSAAGGWQGSTAGEPGAAALGVWQAQAGRLDDGVFRLNCARELVQARIDSMAVVLLHRRVAPATVEAFRRYGGDAARAADLAMLRGVEGHATARYFGELDELLPLGFDLQRRSRRPPRDPVNALLSFGYTLLYQAAHAVLLACGLNPRLGVYHEPRGTHAALASDFIEPFRFLVERQVLSAINRREIKPGDFYQRGDGACLLNPPARARFVLAVHERFQQPVRAARAERALGLYGHLQQQAESLKTGLATGAALYVPRFR